MNGLGAPFLLPIAPPRGARPIRIVRPAQQNGRNYRLSRVISDTSTAVEKDESEQRIRGEIAEFLEMRRSALKPYQRVVARHCTAEGRKLLPTIRTLTEEREEVEKRLLERVQQLLAAPLEDEKDDSLLESKLSHQLGEWKQRIAREQQQLLVFQAALSTRYSSLMEAREGIRQSRTFIEDAVKSSTLGEN